MRRFYAHYLKYMADDFRDKVEIIYYDKVFPGRYSLPRFIDKIVQFFRQFRPYDLIISDYYSPLVFKQAKVKIFVTHGAIYKHNPHKKAIENPKALAYFREKRKLVDHIITIGENDSQFYLRHDKLEDLPLPNFLSLGLPRNDILFEENFVASAREHIISKFNLTSRYFLLWAPTYRPYDLSSQLPFGKKELTTLNDFLVHQDWTILYRPHYFKGIFDEKWIEKLSNIVLLDAKRASDTHKIMAAADMLITDFSSIFVDYLILNRPIAFFQFDEKMYHQLNGYHLNFRQSQFIPGPMLDQLSDFCQMIQAFEKGNDPYQGRRKRAIQYFYTHFDNKSSDRIWHFILRQLFQHT